MQTNLKDILKGKIVIIGIGNIIRGDDGFGPLLIEKITDRVEAICLDGGTAPENYLGKIVKENPDTVLIVDAAHLDKNPGEYEILNREDIVKCGFTTHDISPVMFIEYLTNQTKASIYMLGVQPKSIELGSELSEELKAILDEVSGKILEVVNA
ncbi:MAG: hydrogenase 3 maturation endopeptidase HyCI [Candidatus Omnitrophica bacterium]|nr:hydrogenase 3 maturation endopeptidase HyCI [Candidatus Omnitrophota bacterium]